MSILVHTHDGGRFALEPKEGDTLAKTLFLSRLWHGVALCSGLGKCGLCRVRYTSDAPEANRDELRKLGQEAVSTGWRLSCLHPSESCEIEIPVPARTQRALKSYSQTTGDFSLAVDLGTTSIHWSVLAGKERVASGHELNPQTGLGSEVMTRLAAAATAEGRFVLRALITDRMTELAMIAARNMGGECTGLTISGNSAMTYILLGKKPDDLAAAPYTLSYTGGNEKKIGAGLPPAYIPPLLAPFVGADISAGLTALEHEETVSYPFLLADLGTNGEFVLALSPKKRFCASVPMGPALEGVGLSYGRTAGPGAITGFSLTPTGLTMQIFDDTIPPLGLTGTGYLSLTALLVRHGVLDESGRFGQGNTPLAAKLAQCVTTISGEPAFRLEHNLFLPASDIEEILKVKAAFNLALSKLLKETKLTPAKLATIYIAGALGEHVNLEDLETLGFLPPGSKGKAVKAGNTSLKGSEKILTDPTAREFAERLPKTIISLDLTTDEAFGEHYFQRMCFTYVD
ncbi:ASKHA domain-containing protein [Pseudodesulfovibrio piezophilus]|uniref:Ferredoxin n=1 Tax=Pseudodesulfovibrio piezophilus (strain DSM 21447 / JCM 15486 / C1TLV30) TaxID=1322246 RepID=M1WSY7_PSEP2|nr:ASKHA domain-containing protein [Pseudodesulfovibrio piezophilus]CCH50484.1 Ferredoxin [Pseudodesulfovibrio piezophilus C1TLV30]